MGILDEHNNSKLNEPDEGTVLICKPVDFPGYIVPGSITRECAECGRLIILAPSGQDIIKDNPGSYALCWLCGAKFIEEHPGKLQPPTSAQREEIRQAHEYRRN
jgi:hypothetical protein